jgi:hypothetical protein
MKPRITAVVFSYNRRDVIETVLRSARFADRLIVIDKGSTDGSLEIARAYADEVRSVPWTPTIEPTRAEQIPTIDSEWIVMLDDDECLNLEAIAYIQVAVRRGEFDVHYLPMRHYVLGHHDERGYYWPQHHPVLFRQGSMNFGATVHGGKNRASESHVYVDVETGVSVLHLTHPDARTWIDKTNRYTEELNRASSIDVADLTPDGVRRTMGDWLSKVPSDDEPYLTAIAALRGLYDVVDLVKLWEQAQPRSGGPFAAIRDQLNHDYDTLGIPRSGVAGSTGPTGHATSLTSPSGASSRSIMTRELVCSICGGKEFKSHNVLWPGLIAEWQLSDEEASYVDRQQGCVCTACTTSLRGNALGDAIRQFFGTELPLHDAIDSGNFDSLRLLDVNGVPGLSDALSKLPNYVRRDFPDIDLQAISYAEGSFDLIVHSDTLEHVPQPGLALEECRRVLAPSGRLCFTAPIIVGRMTRNRAGLPPSYHGQATDEAADYIVHSEFGADLWTLVLASGFSNVSLNQVEYPSAIAVSAWNADSASKPY